MDRSAGRSDARNPESHASDLTEAAVLEALSHVKHPEMESQDLVELGMIHAVRIKDRQVVVTLSLPFPKIPVRDQLIEIVKEAMARLDPDAKVEIDIHQMTPEQRAAFSAAAQGRDPAAEGKRQVKHVVAVMSGKGGVGKSSVAGLMACALRKRGLRVGILDADITGPSIPRLFGSTAKPLGSSEGIQPPSTKTGIKLMSINLLLPDEDQPVIWRGPLIGRAIQQFWSDIAWGTLDYLIIDLPPGTSDAALTVMQSLPVHGVVLVTSPQDLAGMVVRKAANMANSLGIPILGLVENMSHISCPQCGTHIELFGPSRAKQTAEAAGALLLGSLPLDPQLAVMCDDGEIEAYESQALDPILDQALKQLPGRQG